MDHSFIFELHKFDEKSHQSSFSFKCKSRPFIKNCTCYSGENCNGGPSFRPQYEDGYHSAFVIELAIILKIYIMKSKINIPTGEAIAL